MVMLPVTILILVHPLIVFVIAYYAGIKLHPVYAMMVGVLMELAVAALFLVFLKEKAGIPNRLLRQTVKSAINVVSLWFTSTADYASADREELTMELASIAVVSSLIWGAVTALAIYALSG
jgi:hypothetical protein